MKYTIRFSGLMDFIEEYEAEDSDLAMEMAMEELFDSCNIFIEECDEDEYS